MHLFDSKVAPGWFDLIALALALGAFYFALRQLKTTQSASERSAEALNLARQKLNDDQLAAAIPQLKSIVNDMDLSLRLLNGDLSQRVLIRFSDVANETVSILKNVSGDHVTFAVKLKSVADKSLDLKGVISLKGMPSKAITGFKGMQLEIEKISAEINEIVTKNRYQLREK